MDNDFCKEKIGISPDIKAYRILVRAPYFEEKTKGGLILTSEFREDMEKLANVGQVLKIGNSAFQGEGAKHFKVNVGDWIIYSKYEREQFLVDFDGKSHRCYFLNDDRIYANLSENDAKIILRGGK